jgi:hypothetical protein
MIRSAIGLLPLAGSLLLCAGIFGGERVAVADPVQPLPGGPAAPTPPDSPAITDEATVERHRDFLTDRGLEALAEGDLMMADRALAAAAELPGDPARQAAAAALAARVHDLRLRRRVPPPPRPRRALPAAEAPSERAPLIGFTTALGLGLYGWALPRALNIDPSTSTRAFVGSYMLIGAASFVVPYLLTRDTHVSPAQVNLAVYGGSRGIWHGLLVGALVGGDLTPEVRSRAWAGSMFAGSLIELLLGYHLAPALAPTPGRARTIAAVGDAGLLLGFGTGYLLRFDRKETADQQARAMAGAGLVGAALGLGSGYLLARARQNSWGDGEVLRASAALGALEGAALADLGGVDLSLDDRTFTSLVMGGGVLGLVGGDLLVRQAEFSVGESLLIDLGTVAGALLGAGVTFLAIKDNGPYLFGSGLGAALGFGVSTWLTPGRTAGQRRHDGDPAALTIMPFLGRHGARGIALAGTL